MYLSSIDIHQVRNIKSLQLDCHPAINVIYGANGSGKTSVLEAIYLLGRGRSFKHRDLRLVINHLSDELVVSAKVERQKPEGSHRLGGSGVQLRVILRLALTVMDCSQPRNLLRSSPYN